MKKILLCVFILLVSVNVFADNVDIEQPPELADDNNESTTQDITSGFYLWMQAAERGDADAQYIIGLCYAEGDGVAKNYEEAIKWFTLSAQQKYPYALTTLGYCYWEGWGVPRNNKLAYMWYFISLPYIPGYTDNDNIKTEAVLEVLKELELNMTATEIAEAQDMAAKWLENNKK